MLRRAALFMFALLALSCDQRSALVVLEPKGANNEVRMEPIAQLIANRTTHVAVDALGNVYWSQESEDGQDLLFVTGPGGNLPQPTTLSSASILAAMKPATPPPTRAPSKSSPSRPPAKPGGNIQSLVAGFDGALYFFFNGGAGAAVGAQAVGRFDPRSGEIQIVADTQQLATISGMGRSLDLARGELLPCGAVIRLFLRHSDNWAILEFEPNRLPVMGQGQLTRKIRNVRINDPVDLTAPQLELAVGPQIPDAAATRQTARNALLMIDRKFGAMYVVDESGVAKFLASMVGVSDSLSEPAIQPASKNADAKDAKSPVKIERILLFAADGPTIDPPISARPEPPDLVTQYPALLMINTTDGKYTAIGRDDIHAPGQFAIYAVRLQQLVPMNRDTFAGYDNSSGQLLKITVTSR